ncbi:TetR/AcrR family transcriptional regulator [Pseudobythopirellula maris]|uniref:TetR/AcrR family transcriptional regulator n=1 Tax=Pseudobythopirellula maris TaxID=2527991 RepID=UPI0011B43E41|nr:TetR/AcrR family transcriptional regulator [Pseudobythopirellula maris]
MQGRPRQFDKDEALEAAMRVFWDRGFHGATCGELLSEMGINAGSMYAAFGDKESLFAQAMRLYVDEVTTRTGDILSKPGSPLQNVRDLVGVWRQKFTEPGNRGCLICLALVNGEGADCEAVCIARSARDSLTKRLEQCFREAGEQGELPEGLDPLGAALFFANMLQGLSVMARNGAKPRDLRAVVDTSLRLLD